MPETVSPSFLILPDLGEVEALRLESGLGGEAVRTPGNGVDHNPTKPLTHSPLKIYRTYIALSCHDATNIQCHI